MREGEIAARENDARLWRADQALLQTKETGRNVTRVYDSIAGLPAKKQIMAS